jgi:hypothetical protein
MILHRMFVGCALLCATAVAAAERTPQAPGPAERFTCGTKKTCAEMASCAEAKFYLEHCGLARLDGDKDGIPCESRCR